eukprot:TRINITY_DN25182_c0_g1_i1.p1 TRINITY_DN25182_c0_g1~~TRINITY_DN25182_c0_g1_i1.p1  ORF type:complete len:245 (-),score=82.67 TRINITY_DN25182_c0_g1_i1:11-745(-)
MPVARMVVMVGPPLSGATTLCSKACSELGATQFRLEDAVETLVRDEASDAGRQLREALSYVPAWMAKQQRAAAAGAEEEEEVEASEGSCATGSRAVSAAPSRSESVGEAGVEDPVVPVVPLTAEVIGAVVSEYLGSLVQPNKGKPGMVVMDGFDSAYLPLVVVDEEETGEGERDWKVLVEALKGCDRLSMRICVLRVDESTVEERRAAMDVEFHACLLYTSVASYEEDSVHVGGRRTLYTKKEG